jgi:hypothetical protein
VSAMHDLVPIYLLLTALAGAVVATIATSVQILPDVIDISVIPTVSGMGSLTLTSYGALRRFHPDRVARLALLGTVAGGLLGIAILPLGLLIEVL